MFENGEILYFASATDDEREIYWGGNHYVGLPIDATGFEMTSKGAPPQPNVTISNIFGAGNTLEREFHGLVGAEMTRYVTLERFLDDGETPDPLAFINKDVYVVAQKMSHNIASMVYKLATRIDVEGAMIPRRQIFRDTCTHTYRAWNAKTNSFDYSIATCPYTDETRFFNILNLPTDAPNDICSRNFGGCKARFTQNRIPGRFFPGVAKVR